ncbi:Zeta toxin [Variovorax sp. YR216]|nr:Zeta toxin [Variovorax sp. YR216]
MLEMESRGGAVEIIGDDLRAMHPSFKRLMAADDQSAAFYTDRDAGRWVEKAISYAKDHRYNVVIEGTFRSSDVVANTMRQFREAGYEIDARALAVNERFSRQGIIERYEAQRAARGSGRMTMPHSHQAAYDGMPLTIERIEREQLVDRLALYRRGNEVIYTNQVKNGRWENPPRAVEALQQERARPWSEHERTAFLDAADRIEAMLLAEGRHATQKEIAAAVQLRSAIEPASTELAKEQSGLVDPLSRYPEIVAARARVAARDLQRSRSPKGPGKGFGLEGFGE